MTNMSKIISIDAETNGLWGEAFSISAVMENNGQITELLLRCPIKGDVNPWVASNVLPQMEFVEVNCEDYDDMLKKFCDFYLANKEDAKIIVHVGLPVEARLFIDAHNKGYIGDWDAPFPLIDISALPGIDASTDTYNKQNGIVLPNVKGETHNPLYDCYSALYAYKHWMTHKG